MYTDIDNQVDYASQMKDDLIKLQNIKIKLFKSYSLNNTVINGIVPHLMNKFEGKIEFVPSNSQSLDVEIILKLNEPLIDTQIKYMTDQLVFDLLWQIKQCNYNVLTQEEWTFIGSKYGLLYTLNIFPEIVIIRF